MKKVGVGVNSKTKVKICGITNLEDALISINAGCDALGFAFFKGSPRYITPEAARKIIRSLPAYVIKIGVFVNAQEKTIKKIARMLGLNMLQFHGQESAEFCSRFKKYKIIKVFRIKDKDHLPDVSKYKVFAYLFDTFNPAKKGGTGERFDWELISHIKGIEGPIFLAGGLTPKNVYKAIKKVKPQWVDVCSSIELAPGKKDAKKVKDFVKEAKRACS